MNLTPEIIYIGGYGRSGSTVLDILLGNGESVAGIGEVAHLFPMLAGDLESGCACGETLSCCPFWRRVLSDFEQQGLNDWPGIARAQRQVEGMIGLISLVRGDFLPGGSREITGYLYRHSMRALFTSTSAAAGCFTLVDSSKTTWSTIGRPLALARLACLNVKLVHLVRDGRAVMWSGAKGTNAALARGRQKASYWRGYRTAVSWAIVNLLTSMMRFLLAPDQFLTLYYEDLMADSLATISRLSCFLDIELCHVKEQVERGDSLQVSHLVGGNRVARQSQIRLCADDEWRKKLPLVSRYLYWFSLWPAALLYRPRKGRGHDT